MDGKRYNEMLEKLFQKEYKNDTTVTLKKMWEEICEKDVTFEEFSKLYSETKRVLQIALFNNYDSPKLAEWLKTTGLPTFQQEGIAEFMERHKGEYIVTSGRLQSTVEKYSGMRYRIDVPVTRRKRTDRESHKNDTEDEEEPIAILSIGEGDGKECSFAAGRREMEYILGGVEQIEQLIQKLSGESKTQ